MRLAAHVCFLEKSVGVVDLKQACVLNELTNQDCSLPASVGVRVL